MHRFYMHCPQCCTRMVKVHDDGASRDREIYYLCKACHTPVTLMVDINGTPEYWPKEIYEIAVEKRLLTREQVPTS